ncbi:MAG: hypothetical protein AAGF47_03530 [Planctomycetota bacterium]
MNTPLQSDGPTIAHLHAEMVRNNQLLHKLNGQTQLGSLVMGVGLGVVLANIIVAVILLVLFTVIDAGSLLERDNVTTPIAPISTIE